MSTTEGDELKAQVFRRLHPAIYLSRFLAESVRPDGRQVGYDAWRDVNVNVGSITTADGSSLVRLGHTTVVCGVKAEICEPEIGREGEGWIVPNIDLPALCSPRFKPGPPAEEAQVLSERLNELLRISNMLPLETLCISAGHAAWVLYVDAVCVNYDGNVFDALVLAVWQALENTRLPQAIYNPDTGKTTCSRNPSLYSSLNIASRPLSISFGLVDGAVLSDPTAFEEPLLSMSVSVILDEEGKILQVGQSGTAGAEGQDVLLECIKAAKERNFELRAAIARPTK